ncbi:sulfatase family protein [Catalinimonas niigatensis]|uniref:sulfatase family protein n=1 Tax=Catalinimonas niigatensis TaxID=1397264 RepID=UPI002665C068|nr:sulfatase [Catalinimonas niigatensis]WPP50750.1 sulfatase [Catalinimonas niigatensis]
MKSSFYILYTTIVLVLMLFSCSEEQAERKPNILFAISDDQSFLHTSFAGRSWVQTPAFDQVAKNGIYFTNCYAGSPGCAPSRSSIVTGRYHWQNEQSGQHASGWLKKYVPFIDMLAVNGYHTGRTGKGVGPFQYGEDPLRAEDAAGKAYNEIRYEEGSTEDERFASGINSTNYFANFQLFMEERNEDEPFFFWYGATEPHRDYELDSWKRHGKSLADVEVPEFLPDNDTVRGDLLDYAIEIEWFDLHLMRMIEHLEEIGELENTIIIVTADNGMPFPRAKANAYEYGVHVPLAISYPKGFPTGRTVDDPISFVDLAPTILELTQTSEEGMLPIFGKSIANILESEKEGIVDESKNYVLAGRERHSASRYMNAGYPQRVMRQGRFLYIWNMKPERWPAGAPQRLVGGTPLPDSSGAVYPMYGIDSAGVHHSDWAFTDIDACPTKSLIVEHYDEEGLKKYFEWAVGKRPEYELFDIEKDPECLTNLAQDPEFSGIKDQMDALMVQDLRLTEDPRIVGPNKEIFDTYKRYSPMREFPKPDWAL